MYGLYLPAAQIEYMPILQIEPFAPLATRGDFLEIPGKERPLPRAQQPLFDISQKFRVLVGIELELIVPVYIKLAKLPVCAYMVKVRVRIDDGDRPVGQALHKCREVSCAYRGIDKQRARLSDEQIAITGTLRHLVYSVCPLAELYGFVCGFHVDISYSDMRILVLRRVFPQIYNSVERLPQDENLRALVV
jgi:hypothetical protein